MFVTLSSMRPTRAIPVALGSLSPETKRSKLPLFVLCGVESFPGADGLLCGQRSYRIVCANYKRSLFFQHCVHTCGHLTSYGHNGFTSGYLPRVTFIDPAIESA